VALLDQPDPASCRLTTVVQHLLQQRHIESVVRLLLHTDTKVLYSWCRAVVHQNSYISIAAAWCSVTLKDGCVQPLHMTRQTLVCCSDSARLTLQITKQGGYVITYACRLLQGEGVYMPAACCVFQTAGRRCAVGVHYSPYLDVLL
jgi:hypothetical protein